MKYGELTLGQIEAMVNKLGGMDGVLSLLRGELVVKAAEHARGSFSRDMAKKENWELVEDAPLSDFAIPNLEILSFLKGNESYISGEEMRKRANELKANLGQHDAEYLLEHQNEIPKEWRNFYLVFPGTIWRTPGGSLHVPYLNWSGGRWCLGFGWLDSYWNSYDQFVRSGK